LLALLPNSLGMQSRMAITGVSYLLALLLTVFALGSDNTSDMLKGRRLSTFDFGDSNTMRAVLVRSGEHGLLIYDPKQRELIFTKMEALKKLKWKRRFWPWEEKPESVELPSPPNETKLPPPK